MIRRIIAGQHRDSAFLKLSDQSGDGILPSGRGSYHLGRGWALEPAVAELLEQVKGGERTVEQPVLDFMLEVDHGGWIQIPEEANNLKKKLPGVE